MGDQDPSLKNEAARRLALQSVTDTVDRMTANAPELHSSRGGGGKGGSFMQSTAIVMDLFEDKNGMSNTENTGWLPFADCGLATGTNIEGEKFRMVMVDLYPLEDFGDLQPRSYGFYAIEGKSASIIITELAKEEGEDNTILKDSPEASVDELETLNRVLNTPVITIRNVESL